MSETLTSPSGRKLPKEIGGYRVMRRLSRGGMGEVLLGQRESHGFLKKVAIKIVLPHVAEDEEFRTLFFDEARLMARMSHSHIAQVFDFGIDDGHLFMVMEFVDGLSVERVFAEQRKRGLRMPPELAALTIVQAARGLHSAHVLTDEQGQPLHVVHRDVSPQNLLITWSGSTKVLDFGIARSNERRGQTQIGVVRGKPGYMAPEQARSQPLDARTDIFQLGIVLFELLSGRELYVRNNMYEAIAAAVEEPVPDIVAEVPGIDPGYGDVLMAALAKSPDERFTNADAMARALDAVIARAGYPVSDASLADHMQTMRPPASAPAPPTQAREGAADSRQSGRATGMGTVELADPAQVAAAAVHANGSPAAGYGQGQSSEPPRPATETGQPTVKTFTAHETLKTPVVGTDAAVASIARRRRRQLWLVVGGILSAAAMVAGLAVFVFSERGLEIPSVSSDPASPGAAVSMASMAKRGFVVTDGGRPESPVQEEVAQARDGGAQEATARVPKSSEERPRRRRKIGRRRTSDLKSTRSSDGESGRGRLSEPASTPALTTRDSASSQKETAMEHQVEKPVRSTPYSPKSVKKVSRGTLFVVSEPYAHIFVDGERMGDTPKLLRLPVGSHEIKLVDPQSGETWLKRQTKVKKGRNKPFKAKRNAVAP